MVVAKEYRSRGSSRAAGKKHAVRRHTASGLRWTPVGGLQWTPVREYQNLFLAICSCHLEFFADFFLIFLNNFPSQFLSHKSLLERPRSVLQTLERSLEFFDSFNLNLIVSRFRSPRQVMTSVALGDARSIRSSVRSSLRTSSLEALPKRSVQWQPSTGHCPPFLSRTVSKSFWQKWPAQET